MKNKVYIVMAEYTQFDDYDNNYSEIKGVYKFKERAEMEIIQEVKKELSIGMIYKYSDLTISKEIEVKENTTKIMEELNTIGYVSLEQTNGYGIARIILEEKDLI